MAIYRQTANRAIAPRNLRHRTSPAIKRGGPVEGHKKLMLKWVAAALVVGGSGYLFYDYYRGGFFTAPELQEGEFLLSFKGGLRGVMRGVADERHERRYLGYPARDVPPWYEETWSVCRKPSEDEIAAFDSDADIGPGGRLDAVCEIDADGDVFVRGWIASVPDL